MVFILAKMNSDTEESEATVSSSDCEVSVTLPGQDAGLREGE